MSSDDEAPKLRIHSVSNINLGSHGPSLTASLSVTMEGTAVLSDLLVQDEEDQVVEDQDEESPDEEPDVEDQDDSQKYRLKDEDGRWDI